MRGTIQRETMDKSKTYVYYFTKLIVREGSLLIFSRQSVYVRLEVRVSLYVPVWTSLYTYLASLSHLLHIPFTTKSSI